MAEESGAIGIVQATGETLDGWAALRHELWPHLSEQEHRLEAGSLLETPEEAVAFIALNEKGAVVAFAEAALRHDYVNGCDTSPVAFLEGIFVHPDVRRRGIARRLCRAVEDWALRLGCEEFASDTELHNTGSQAMHVALGFEETERIVYYRRRLSPDL